MFSHYNHFSTSDSPLDLFPPKPLLSRLPMILILPNPMASSHWHSTLTTPPLSLKQLSFWDTHSPRFLSTSWASLQCLLQVPHPLFVGGPTAPHTTSLALGSTEPLAHPFQCIVDNVPWMPISPLTWHMAQTSYFPHKNLCLISGNGTTIHPRAQGRHSESPLTPPMFFLSCNKANYKFYWFYLEPVIFDSVKFSTFLQYHL